MKLIPLKIASLIILFAFACLLALQGYISLSSLFEPTSFALLCFVAAGLYAVALIAGIVLFRANSRSRWIPLLCATLGSLAFAVRIFLLGAPDDFSSILGAVITSLITAVPTIGAAFFLALPETSNRA